VKDFPKLFQAKSSSYVAVFLVETGRNPEFPPDTNFFVEKLVESLFLIGQTNGL